MARRALSLRPAGLDALSMQAAPNLALNQALSQALMDFAAAPGRHALRLREPAILFDGLDTVALWALGRMPVGLAEPQPLRQAALLFVLRACFAPDLNHYQLLGLSPGFSAAQLRSRYRALIRLTHPDMGIEGLPAEAAGMVNRAHAVLGDGPQRAAYDRRLLTQLPTAAGAPKAKPHDTPHAKGQHKGQVRGHGPGRTGAAAGMGQRVPAGSRWAGLRHVVQAKGLRLVSLVGALSLGVLGLLVWATQGSGNEGRLVVTQRSANSSDSAPVKPETVALRVPAQWQQGIGAPLANVPTAPHALPTRTSPSTAPGRVSAGPIAVAAAPSVAETLPAAPALAGPKSEKASAPSLALSASAPSLALSASAPSLALSASLAKPAIAAAPPQSADPSLAISASSATSPALNAAPTALAEPALPAGILYSRPITWSSPDTGSDRVLAHLAPDSIDPQTPPPADKFAAERLGALPAKGASDVFEEHIVWDVDVQSARMYLQDLLNQLADPEQARLTSYALKQMNVRGSLLRPADAAGYVLGSVQIERADLRESHSPGVLRIRGVMQANERLPGDQRRALRWRVQADFKGTAQGTVLTLLDLKETE